MESCFRWLGTCCIYAVVMPPPVATSQAPDSGFGPEPVLTRRRYAAEFRELGEREWLVALGERPLRWFVPLGTTNASTAGRQARKYAAEVARCGWESTGSVLPREFTLAISWLESPMAWTYVSLVTLPKTCVALAPQPGLQPLRVALIEPDEIFREALVHWLGRIPGVTCTAWASEQSWWQSSRRSTEVDVLLVNRFSPAFVAGRFQSKKGAPAPASCVFGYGIYPHSDDIFASVSGVDAGYYLRRRSLSTLLDPLAEAYVSGHWTPAEVPRALRRYFQNSFNQEAQDRQEGGLTTRERQILASIQRGLRDKEIATALGISPLTVHTHLKNIFHKLGTHTRTEAVVKYLEK